MTRLLSAAALLLAAATPAPGADAPRGAQHLPAAPEPAALMPRYLLMDPQGRAVTIDDFRGRYQLIAFGFVS